MVSVSTLDGKRRENMILRLIARDGPRCFYCGLNIRDLPGENLTIDHFHPRSKGGTNAISNLRLACRTCNGLKGDVPGEEFLESETLNNRRDLLDDPLFADFQIQREADHPKIVQRIVYKKGLMYRCLVCGTERFNVEGLRFSPCRTFEVGEIAI